MPHFLNQNIHQVLWTPLEVWLGEHPFMHWFIVHPLVLLGFSLIALLLLAGLMSAIAHLTQNLWLRLLQLPIQIVQALGKAIATSLQWLFQRLFARPTSRPNDIQAKKGDSAIQLSHPDLSYSSLEDGSPHHELQHLLNRLDNLRQEEADLIEKIKTLVEEQSS